MRVKLIKYYERSQDYNRIVESVSQVLDSSIYYDNYEWCNYTAQALSVIHPSLLVSLCGM